MLLNSILTVREGQPLSHQGKGWETFTDKVVDALNKEREGLVFLLWGSYAQKKGALIDGKKHLIFSQKGTFKNKDNNNIVLFFSKFIISKKIANLYNCLFCTFFCFHPLTHWISHSHDAMNLGYP